MKCIILAAGYATRLYPLTKDWPKSLLPLGEQTILEFIMKKIEDLEIVDRIFVVTNDRFFRYFTDWSKRYLTQKQITILSDGSTTNENRLGAIADIQFTVDNGSIDEDILVLAGDNIFDFSLMEFVAFFEQMNHDCITTHELHNLEELQRTGVVEINENQMVIGFEEKPIYPKSSLAVPPLYIYKRDTLPLLKRYLVEGNNPDAPGNFIPWLIAYKDVYAYKFSGKRLDIGTLENYRQVCGIYGVPTII